MSEQQNSGPEPYTIAVVGAGPRGTSVLERLLAALRQAEGRGRPIRLLVFDQFEPGAGRVWSTAQSRLFLMNTPSVFPTVAPERTHPDEPGLSFEQWRASGGDGALLSTVEAQELAELERGSYPPRALYGRYLRHVFESVAAALRHLEQVVEVRFVRSEVRSLVRDRRPLPAGRATRGRFLPASARPGRTRGIHRGRRGAGARARSGAPEPRPVGDLRGSRRDGPDLPGPERAKRRAVGKDPGRANRARPRTGPELLRRDGGIDRGPRRRVPCGQRRAGAGARILGLRIRTQDRGGLAPRHAVPGQGLHRGLHSASRFAWSTSTAR